MPTNPARPWPERGHVPLEPTPPHLPREGVLGPPYQGPKGICQGPSSREPPLPGWATRPPLPPPSTFSLSCRAHLGPVPSSLAHTSILRGLGTPPASGSSYQYASPPGREGADGCPGWGAGCHRACPPPVWVPTAQHAPGLEGVSPLQLSPWALVGGAGRSPWGLEAPGSARMPAAPPPPPPQTEPRRGCGGKWYCIAGSVPSAPRSPDGGLPPSIPRPPGENVSWAGPRVRVQQLPPPPPRERRRRASRGGTGSVSAPCVSFCK